MFEFDWSCSLNAFKANLQLFCLSLFLEMFYPFPRIAPFVQQVGKLTCTLVWNLQVNPGQSPLSFSAVFMQTDYSVDQSLEVKETESFA